MERLLLTLLAAGALALPAFAQVKPAESHTPRYGGVVVETKSGDLEVVAKADVIHVYVSDHGKPMKLASGSGKVTVFNGSEKAEAPLTLVGDKLEAKGSFQCGIRHQGACGGGAEPKGRCVGTDHGQVNSAGAVP